MMCERVGGGGGGGGGRGGLFRLLNYQLIASYNFIVFPLFYRKKLWLSPFFPSFIWNLPKWCDVTLRHPHPTCLGAP